MDKIIEQYFTLQTSVVRKKLNEIVNETNVNDCYKALTKYFSDKGSVNYINYYLQTIADSQYLLTEPFFRKFKKMYSLQGIDNSFLDDLEEDKKLDT